MASTDPEAEGPDGLTECDEGRGRSGPWDVFLFMYVVRGGVCC